MFDAIGFVPVAYTTFAVALGTTCGALTRRTLGAMVLVLVLFVGLRVSVAVVARPQYQPAVTGTATITHAPGSEPVGVTFRPDPGLRACRTNKGTAAVAMSQCARHSLHPRVRHVGSEVRLRRQGTREVGPLKRVDRSGSRL